MELLYLFESIRTPILDKLFLLLTQIGDEIVFIIIALAVFWCVNKKTGYYLMTVCFFGIVLNQTLKLMFRIPRPWVRDPDFTIVEAAREAASGYSFPSGHTQNAVSIFGCIGVSATELAKNKKTRNIIWILCIFFAAAVALSRMYLGVHTPADVGVSTIIALALVFIFHAIFKAADSKNGFMYIVIAAMLGMAAVYLIYASTVVVDSEAELVNVTDGIKHAWYMLGGVFGIAAAYPLEKNLIRFETKAGALGQILKLILGFAAVLVIKSLLKSPLLTLFGGHPAAHAVRYFCVVFFAVCVWPLTFKFFAKLKINGDKK